MNIQTGENMNYARTVSSVQFSSQSHIAYSETVNQKTILIFDSMF